MQTSSGDNPGAPASALIVHCSGGNMFADSVRSTVEEGITPGRITIVDNGSRDNATARIQMEFPAVPILHNDGLSPP